MTTASAPSLSDAVGAASEPQPFSWSADDSLLYALGVGAGVDELSYTTENSAGFEHTALPTLPVAVGQRAKVFHLLGELDWTKIVHAEQAVELLRPVPVAATVLTTGSIAAVWDTGKHATAAIEFSSRGADDGEEWFRTRMTLMIRGAGGWGGEPGPLNAWAAPDRAPEHVVTERTRPEQALLYRLSGDRNRLHSDPSFARKAGFDRPILHGLCTYGFAGRALLSTVCDGDAARVYSMKGRFTAPVFPGDELTTEIWRTDEGALFRTVGPSGPVISHGRLGVRHEAVE